MTTDAEENELVEVEQLASFHQDHVTWLIQVFSLNIYYLAKSGL